MLLNTYLGSLRVRRQETAWEQTRSDHLDTVRLDLPPPATRQTSAVTRVSAVPAALVGLVNLASVRGSAARPTASGRAEVSDLLRSLVPACREPR